MTPALPCPECGAPLVLKEGRFGKFYRCAQWRYTGCRGSHSAHQATGKPMGTPAKAEVKAARMRAHRAFDELWTTGRMSRKQAYTWLQKVMQMTKRQSHIARMGVDECEKLLRAVDDLRKKR